MAVSCNACGAEPREGARFCDACGSPVTASDSRAEYKQVTVLFADVIRSMDIAAALGPERLREVMGELFNRASAIIQRHGGTVDKFTGDGVMAVFGAPYALEDHALRACRAALDIQADALALAAEVERCDNIALQLRVGLNSGEVITGEIGSGSTTYTAVGEQVGMAQRMESVAPPGGVLISETTARLVEGATMLGEVEWVRIKGADDPVPSRTLLAVTTGRTPHRVETTFVGREWEMGALSGILDRSIAGNGSVVGVVGPPGIGKSRIVRELVSLATGAGIEVAMTHCESHTCEVPFHAVSGLHRAAAGAHGLQGEAARVAVRARLADADAEDLVLLEDLLGIGDPAAVLPQIDPDARRRRLAALVNTAVLARNTPVLYVIEDAHWIDETSEAMIAEFLSVIPRTPSLVVITYRPEYVGALARAPRAQTIALEPLGDSQSHSLVNELLGADPSVAALADAITERASGNPFFVEEIARDMAERGVLVGERGRYVRAETVADVVVPSTLQATIAARIDRLDAAAKVTLNAAAVIGSRFSPDMVRALGIDAVIDELVRAELVDQTAFSPQTEYTFRHPLIRAVAYESQLKSDRAKLHRRLASGIEQNDQNAALIAEHFDAAGDPHAAYAWHMRAGAWLTNRDSAAAQLSWERARQVADALPADDPEQTAMSIAPRTLLCANAWRRFHESIADRFEELRDLCTAADDKASLAVGMAGQVMEHVLQGKIVEASRLASECMALVESLADPELSLELSFAACIAKLQAGEVDDVLRWSQTVIDLAGSDPSKGGRILGSPLATALVFRGVARWTAAHPGWRDDFDRAVTMARTLDLVSQATVLGYKYVGIAHWVLLADDAALADITEAARIAERSSDDIALIMVRQVLGIALVHRSASDRQPGFDLLAQLRETCVSEGFALNIVPLMDVYAAREKVANGDLDGAIALLRMTIEEMFTSGNIGNITVAIATLVEALVARDGPNDLAEAEAAVEKCDAWQGVVGRAVMLRLWALLARARGDDAAYRDYRDRYRTMAIDIGFEGHIALADAMP